MFKTLIVLFLIVFFTGLTFRLTPMYQEYFSAKHIMSQIEQDISLKKMSTRQVRASLQKLFSINAIDNIRVEDIDIKSNASGSRVEHIIIDYQVIKPFVAHLSLLADFHLEAHAK